VKDMDETEFEAFVEKAIISLPKEFSEKLENINLMISDWPNPVQQKVLKSRSGRNLLLGLYEGIPQTRRGSYGIGGALPDKITIFRLPILMISETSELIEQNIRDTVIHEIGHHFGLSDEDIERAVKRR
jgi:predicted Zn-dependent protease with MMP-like domain